MLDIFIAYFFLAAGIVCNKYVLQSISAEFFVALRMLTSGIILLISHRFHTETLTYTKVKKDIPYLLFIAVCTTLVPALLKAWSLKHMFASKQALLGSIDPFITALLVYIIFSEKITLQKALGMAVGFIGALIVIFSQSPLEKGYELFWTISYPELALIAAVIISRYGWILVQDLLRNNKYDAVQINTLMQITAGGLSLIIALINGQVGWFTVTYYPFFWGALIFTIVGGNIIGYTLYAQSLKHHSATLVSLAGFSIPLLVTLFAYLFLGETIGWPLIVGGASIFAGLVIFLKKP